MIVYAYGSCVAYIVVVGDQTDRGIARSVMWRDADLILIPGNRHTPSAHLAAVCDQRPSVA